MLTTRSPYLRWPLQGSNFTHHLKNTSLVSTSRAYQWKRITYPRSEVTVTQCSKIFSSRCKRMVWPVASLLTAIAAKPPNSIRQRLPLNKPQIRACSSCRPRKFRKKSCYPTRFTSATTMCQIVSTSTMLPQQTRITIAASKMVVSLTHRCQNW